MAARPGTARANWVAVHLWRQRLGQNLAQRHALRLHGLAIGSMTLLVTWGASHLQLLAGGQSLALRYLVSLGLGYLVYLGLVRLWAAWLLRRPPGRRSDGGGDVPDVFSAGSGEPCTASPGPEGGGGDFAGGGASGDWLGPDDSSLGEAAGAAWEAVASADEGAVVVVPVLAIFGTGLALLLGAGALAWLLLGSEVLLAAAVELAFALSTARAFVGVERAGWLSAVLRLTYKPLLAALACAVLLGAAIDYTWPQAQSLPEALRLWRQG